MHNKSEEIISTIHRELDARTSLDTRWLEWWKLYKTEPLRVAKDDSWQSKLNDGRVFEIIETISTYLNGALFYSDAWVNLEANEPDLAEILPIVTSYFRDCLNNSNLKREMRLFLRQLLLTGFCSMSCFWEDERLKFKTLDSFNVFFESTRRLDCNSYTFVRHYINYAEYLDLLEAGTIEVNEDPEDFWNSYKSTVSSVDDKSVWLTDTGETSSETMELFEYWCPIEKCIYRFIGEECVGQEEMDKCPWLLMVLYELPNAAYGLGVLDSSIGLILENNCIMNRRLDNMAISVDNMWLLIDDGVLDQEDLEAQPGKVFKVANKDTLTPLYPPSNNFNVTYNESAIIDQRIEKNTGTGALISSGQYRSGERVTAQEIQAVKEAGGTRLTDVYEHIEASFIVPLLKVALETLKTNTKGNKVVKLPSERANVFDYFKLLPSDLTKDYSVKVTASQNVINRDRHMRRFQEFIQTVVSVPQFAEQTDFTTLFEDLVTRFGFDNPSRYIKKQEEQPQPTSPQAPVSPSQAYVDEMGQVMGQAGTNAALEQMASGQLTQMAQNMGTLKPTDTPTDTSTQAQLMMNTPM